MNFMPWYVLLMNWTDQGVRAIKDVPRRAVGADELIRKIGGRWVHRLFTLGEYDIVSIVEAPNDEAIYSIVLELQRRGNMRITTLRAFAEEEAGRMMREL
jgi:uncharacterized protein with GYD domain